MTNLLLHGIDVPSNVRHTNTLALNAEFEFPYPPFKDAAAEAKWTLLYRTADDKLVAFLGLVGTVHPNTKFIVYSRGTDGIWPDEVKRKKWVHDVEQRFPVLKDRITPMLIPGGTGANGGTFKDAATAAEMRGHVQTILGLPKTKSEPAEKK